MFDAELLGDLGAAGFRIERSGFVGVFVFRGVSPLTPKQPRVSGNSQESAETVKPLGLGLAYMLYRMADCTSAAHIGKMVDSKYYVQKSDVTQSVYQQIRDGLYASEETPQRIVKYAAAVGI